MIKLSNELEKREVRFRARDDVIGDDAIYRPLRSMTS